MGQCYTVYLKLKYDDEKPVVINSKYFILKNDGQSVNFSLNNYHKDNQMRTINDILEIMITKDFLTWDDETYEADFNASYGWEIVLDNWFRQIAPVLNDGSYIEVYPDEGSWKITKHKGELEEVWRM